MKTPIQELFHRVEQLRFAKNPIDELMKIEIQMLEKEKQQAIEFASDIVNLYAIVDEEFDNEIEWRYNEKYGSDEK